MAGSLSAFLIFSMYLVYANTEGIPALLWRTSLEGAYPVSLTGHTLDANTFYKGYLQQLVDNPNTNVVVFMQDKLSIEDITRYADVFNEQSQGAVFKNLRSIMEEHESTHVPNVRQPVDAVKKLEQAFKGNVIRVENPDDASELVLSPDQASLIIVTLPETSGRGKLEALVKSDELMGQLTKKLAASDRPFTAVYTGLQLSTWMHKDIHRGRHLLQSDDASNNYTLIKLSETGSTDKSCFLMYFNRLEFKVLRANGNEVPSTTNATFVLKNLGTVTSIDGATCSNGSADFTATYSGDDLPAGLSSFSMKFTMASSMRYWYIKNLTLSYDANVGSEAVNANQEMMENNANSIFGVIGYPGADGSSYHCGTPEPIKQFDRKSSKDNIVNLKFTEWQLQLGVRNFTFARADDCIGFFSEAIWMGLIATLVLLLIVTFGIAMLANINTMDRFDDPKGKSIQVNVADN